jgi:hypothetical protein
MFLHTWAQQNFTHLGGTILRSLSDFCHAELPDKIGMDPILIQAKGLNNTLSKCLRVNVNQLLTRSTEPHLSDQACTKRETRL